MAYQVIARKWRPQSFADLIGQEHISTTIVNALRHGRLHPALLFTGMRGTGKTSSARILAKSLRCPNAKDFVPCGTCPECQDIAESRSLNVIEIDGASNNGVDAIRELIDTVGYMPSSGKYKIYIIDEVHMLSTSAFNALLKTLEEPPAHVRFVLATTEVQKIPETILSRCQRFDFRRIPSRLIASQLTKICEAESVQFEPEALWMIARQADGSLRDSQSLLDQVITYCDNKVTLAKVVEVLGLTDRALLLDTLAALVDHDAAKVVDVIEKVFKSGYDAKIFAQDLLEEIRNALLVRLCPTDPTRVVDLPDSEITALKQLTAPLSEEDLHFHFDMALKGVNDLLRAQDPRIVLEMLLLRMAAAPRIASLAAIAAGGVAPAVLPSAAAPAAAAPAASGGAKAAPADAKNAYTMASFIRPAPGASPDVATEAVKAAAAMANQSKEQLMKPAAAEPVAPKPVEQDAAPKVDPAKANDPWYRFVEDVKKANGLLGAMLENTHLISTNGGTLTIGVPKKMSFMFEKVKEPENIKRIETFLETFWNKTYKVDVKLADEKVEKVTPKAMQDEHQQAQKRSVEQQVENNPLVKTAQNVFKTQIKSIKDKREST